MDTLPAGVLRPDVAQTDDQKWKAWAAKGRAHDRLVRGRLGLVAKAAAVVAVGVAIAAVLLG